jgi:hypothetical protein
MAPLPYSDDAASPSRGRSSLQFDSPFGCRSSALLLLDLRRTLEASAVHRHGWRSKWPK